MEPSAPRIALALMLGATLVAAGVEDARTRNIANWKSIAIALLAPAWWWANGASAWPGVAIQIGMAALVFTVFAGAFHLGAMGGGDVKLVAALSLWLPPAVLPWMLVAMSLAGGAVTLAMLADSRMARRDAPVEAPYGVAIAAAGLLSLGEPILNQFG